MSAEPLTSADVVLWALFELEGSDEFVDVENVFLEAFKIAPQRFGWRTRPDIPDKLKGNAALHGADVRSPKLLIKRGPDHRQLTLEGQRWIEDNFERLADALGGDRIVEAPKGRKSSRLVSEAVKAEAFKVWSESGSLPAEKWKFADMLHCSHDSAQSVWRGRLEALRSAAYVADRNDLLSFLDLLATEHVDWF